jgi:fatty acid desaturase
MMLETTSPTTASAAKQESLARAIVQLNPKSARAKRVVALVTVGIPAVGFAIGVYLGVAGTATVLDYLLFAVFYVVQMFGVSIGFHRYLAHNSFKTSPFFEGVLMVTGSMALEGPVLFWVSTHRRHRQAPTLAPARRPRTATQYPSRRGQALFQRSDRAGRLVFLHERDEPVHQQQDRDDPGVGSMSGNQRQRQRGLDHPRDRRPAPRRVARRHRMSNRRRHEP